MNRPMADRLPGLREVLQLAERRLSTAIAFLVVLAVLLAHAPLRHSAYVQDDHLAVEENKIARTGDLGEILSTSYWAGAEGEDGTLYRPVTILSYALEQRVTNGPVALVSQAVNIGLHLMATLLLYALARRIEIGPFAAAATALLFAVHPVHVEAVANIVGRAEILAALCSFGGLLLLSRSGDWTRAGRLQRPGPAAARAAAWGAALLLFLALGAKEIAIATPLLYVALELLFRPRRDPRRVFWVERAAALAPSALAGVVYVCLRVRALEMLLSLQQAHPSDNPLVTLHGVERAATALGLVARAARLLFFPLGLSADYSGPVIDVESALVGLLPLAGSLILVACATLALAPLWSPRNALGTRRRSFVILLFVLPYLVIGNLLVPVGTVFAERLLYFPSAGFCLLLGLVFGQLLGGLPAPPPEATAAPQARSPRRLAVLALATLVTGFLVMTWARSHDWRNDETVFRAAIQVTPASPRAHYIVGKLLSDRGEADAALEHLRRTIDLDPRHIAAWNETGVVHGRLGELEAAERAFRRAIAAGPEFGDGHFNLGVTLRRLGRANEAERSLRRALLWDPAFAKAWAEYGNLMLDRGRPREAAVSYRRAIALGRKDLMPRLREAERRSGGS